MIKNYYVMPYDGNWVIVEEDTNKIISICSSQDEALEEAMIISLPKIYKQKIKQRAVFFSHKGKERPS